jgi:hypothetical protein
LQLAACRSSSSSSSSSSSRQQGRAARRSPPPPVGHWASWAAGLASDVDTCMRASHGGGGGGATAVPQPKPPGGSLGLGPRPGRKCPVPSDVIKRAHATRLGQHLAAGRCGRACRASTSLAPLYSPCASSKPFDWGSNSPSRSALAPVRGVAPGAGVLAGCRTPIPPVCFTNAAALRGPK